MDRYVGRVRRIAALCFRRRIGNELEFCDFVQFGMVGLLEAIDRYDPSRGIQFETYAHQRIEGAILSGIENLSELQQQIASRRKRRESRTRSLVEEARRSPSQSALERLADVAICLALGFALEDSGMYVDGESSASDLVFASVEMRQLKRQIADLVNQLPEKERLVIFRHYFQQLAFQDIAVSLELTKGRVAQLHHAGLQHLRAKFRDNKLSILSV